MGDQARVDAVTELHNQNQLIRQQHLEAECKVWLTQEAAAARSTE